MSSVAESSNRVSGLPLPPVVPDSILTRLRMAVNWHVGGEHYRDTVGPVATVHLGPRRVIAPFVYVTSARGAHDVLAGFDGSVDKEQIVHVQTRVWGLNLFNVPHEVWKPRRRAIQPLFTKQRVASYAGHMAAIAAAASEQWVAQGEVDLDRETRKLTLNVLGQSVLGLELADRAAELSPHVHRVIEYPMRRATQPARLPMSFPSPARASFRRSLRALRQVLDEAIDACLADPNHHAPLVRQLLAAVDPETGTALSRAAVRDELLAFLIAGHDTTATTLAYTLWQLGRNPAIQQRVADEAHSLGPGPIRAEDVSSLPYTVQVLHEALRLCPPAAGVGRMAMRDVEVDGYRVPKGYNIILGFWGIHRDPNAWTEPLRFDPDRFAQGRDVDRWQYLPFGAGPRSCIGDHFAMLEATIGLATLVRTIQIEARESEFPVSLPFTTVAAGPIPAKVTARV